MASLQVSWLRKVLCLFLVFIITTFLSTLSHQHDQPQSNHKLISGTRRARILLSELVGDEDEPKPKAKLSIIATTTKTSNKNQTKLIKPSSTSSKIIKPLSSSSKNKTKLIKPTTSDSMKDSSTFAPPTKIKKLNTTSISSSKSTPLSTKKSSNPTKLTSSENKTTKPIFTKESKINQEKITLMKPKSDKTQPGKPKKDPNWIERDDEEDDDLFSEFKDLPLKFQETFVPDWERISKTSRVYLNKYNKEITRNFKPYVGHKYAPAIASFASFAFIIVPLILVSLVFRRIKAYFSLQKLLIFIQIYLAIYFSILCLSALVTGLEPLRFLYSTSLSSYVCVQVLQTLGYVLYLLLLLMYLVLVFATETGPVTKILGLVQAFVGFSIGLHYYINVFHRAVLHQPPKCSWKVHGFYATCFVVICLLGNLDTRKKAYLVDGGEEGKKS